MAWVFSAVPLHMNRQCRLNARLNAVSPGGGRSSTCDRALLRLWLRHASPLNTAFVLSGMHALLWHRTPAVSTIFPGLQSSQSNMVPPRWCLILVLAKPRSSGCHSASWDAPSVCDTAENVTVVGIPSCISMVRSSALRGIEASHSRCKSSGLQTTPKYEANRVVTRAQALPYGSIYRGLFLRCGEDSWKAAVACVVQKPLLVLSFGDCMRVVFCTFEKPFA